jgi:hypothetical protein
MGRTLLLLVAFLTAARPPAAPPAAAPPDTEILLAPLAPGASTVVGHPVNITNSPGYDNQPAFTPDGTGMLFTSFAAARRPTSTGTTSRPARRRA